MVRRLIDTSRISRLALCMGLLVCVSSVSHADQTPAAEPIVPFPKVALSDPDRNVFTIYDRAGRDAPVRSWTFVTSKDVTAAVTGIGLIKNGEIIQAKAKPGPYKITSAIVLTFNSPVKSSLIGTEHGPIDIIITSRYNSDPSVIMRQSIFKEYCNLEPAEHGLFRIVDGNPDDGFTRCGFGDGRYLSAAQFDAEDIIDCLAVGDGRCEQAFQYNGWNIGTIFRSAGLSHWKEIRTAVRSYLKTITME